MTRDLSTKLMLMLQVSPTVDMFCVLHLYQVKLRWFQAQSMSQRVIMWSEFVDELPVTDIDIQEVPIEDVIRQIFAR